ncbi:kinesin-like protein KIN-14I isoform X2 [Physcomitrium patens]|uniref:Kinesin-like calmodulin-binding protein n=1 Tax=Physcomitrium patens TaxID=3218 RepID=A0A2K1JTM2_PHYPA|nr:kinesin-like protein KIN-14I isoform X2 [Physcomitrium patens]PNR44879.1 hypothetical protein PHYPA_014649 [Physcomitrium patens]|eukprot:XP_024387891.1 kinesin-like protein KIN-14I isoform X2 [Physcomitrella patens]
MASDGMSSTGLYGGRKSSQFNNSTPVRLRVSASIMNCDDQDGDVDYAGSRPQSRGSSHAGDINQNQSEGSENGNTVHGVLATTFFPSDPLASGPVLEKYQVEAFLKSMQRIIQIGGRRSYFGKKFSISGRDRFTLEDMLSYQRDPIPTSLLRLNSDSMTRAVKLFQVILKYTGADLAPGSPPPTVQEQIDMVLKLYNSTLKRAELRDELFVQLSKQIRNNPDRSMLLKAWELLFLCASAMPPTKDFAAPLSEYVHDVANTPGDTEIQRIALNTLNALKRSVKGGPRRITPTAEEIEALLESRNLTTLVYFLDDTFEEITYDMTSTIADAVEQLAGIIKLASSSTFGLFECRKSVTGSKISDSGNEEHIGLDDNKYIGDIVAEFKTIKEKAKGELQCRLLFKKRLFRESDEAIVDPMFVQLLYVQSQHDYMLGNYPVGRDDAAQLAALQILVDIGPVPNPESTTDWQALLDRSLPKQIAVTRARRDWELDILNRYQATTHLSKAEARQQLLRILRSLPYGNSVFFTVTKIEDPIGLLPGRIILGINKRGVHFFRPVPKEYLHSAELRDIMQFGSSNTAVFFKMRVAGVLHIFQFETKQGEDICVALQTHINDVMLRRYSRNKNIPNGQVSNEVDTTATLSTKPAGLEVYEKHVQEMSKLLEESQRKIDQLSEAIRIKDKRETLVMEELAGLRDSLRAEEQTHSEIAEERERLTKQLVDMEGALQVALTEKASLIASVGGSQPGDDATSDMSDYETSIRKAPTVRARRDRDFLSSVGKERKDDQIRTLENQIKEIRAEVRLKTEDLRKHEDKAKNLLKDKQLLEQKIGRLEKNKVDETRGLEHKFEQERDELRARVAENEKKLQDRTQELSLAEQQLSSRSGEFDTLQANVKELEELREMKEDIDRKNLQTAAILKRQADQIVELQALYKEEQILRKRYFNMMEDMKGKIRVYARWRPLSDKEIREGEKLMLTSCDEFTIEHPWKDDKIKQHQFDHIFDQFATQEEVFEDTKYLVQSAIDGYNVCIFAFGQTGSGKTYTIYGSNSNPGLTPRVTQELFNCMKRDSNKFQFSLQVYMLEIYQDTLVDLLQPKFGFGGKPRKLDIKKDTKGMVVVENATLIPVVTREELDSVIAKGLEKRHTSGTQMNAESSRSHLILSIIIESTNLQSQVLMKGKLSLVDLAGSERVKKSGSSGEQLKEAQSINKSLSALGDVISALATDEQHIPYRNHKLTMLMSDSLGGNAKALMFANISPAGSNLEETHNSLCYATRVRSIINDPSKNLTTKEILRLKKQVQFWKERAGNPGGEELEEVVEERLKYAE